MTPIEPVIMLASLSAGCVLLATTIQSWSTGRRLERVAHDLGERVAELEMRRSLDSARADGTAADVSRAHERATDADRQIRAFRAELDTLRTDIAAIDNRTRAPVTAMRPRAPRK